MLRDYYSLVKPGIVYGNAVLLAGGFALALQGGVVDPSTSVIVPIIPALKLFLFALVGLSFVIASGCVFNNYIDRGIDGKMERTKDRALVTHRISNRAAIIYGIVLGAIGFALLAIGTNLLTVAVAAIGAFFYVVMYTIWAKRRTMYAVAVGAVAGAVPPVVGYVAVSNKLDLGAVLLFMILFTWQIPHFFAISIRRSHDYVAAGVPILPAKHGNRTTKIAIVTLVMAYIYATVLLAYFGYINPWYGILAAALGFVWFVVGVRGFYTRDDVRWARSMFLCSLVVLMALFATIIIGSLAFVQFS